MAGKRTRNRRTRATGTHAKRSLVRRIAFALLTLFLIGVTTAAICLVALACYINFYIKPNSQIDIENMAMKFNSIIYYTDADGEQQELQKLASSENREWVNFEDIPENLTNAFVAIEDKRFYEHQGVDWKRTVGAILNYLPSGASYGGSTITQQVIKNMTGDNDVTVKRKINEIVRALALEDQTDKQSILEMYMNVIYLGENAYGVQIASKTYFNKEVQDLDLAECALIAGLTKNPTGYDPFKNPDKAKERQETVLGEMFSQGYITEKQYKKAMKETLDYKEGIYHEESIGTYSWFTDMVITDVENDLMDAYGYSKDYAKTLVTSGGLSIYATVDKAIQDHMESIFEDADNFPYISQDGEIPQAAMIILDPENGYIRGVVGGRGEKTESRILNRATQSKRPSGSSIKPLSTYAPALDEKLITPYSVVTDMPVKVDKNSGEAWPRNENRIYKGQTTIMNGVAASTNTVAVQVMKKLKVKNAYKFLTEKLGFTTLVEDDKDYAPLALGGQTEGVTVREMAQGYTALANYGKYSEAVSYSKVVDANGNTILSNEDNKATQVFERPKVTPYYVNDLLSNVCINGTGRDAKMLGIETAGKTGTTTDNKDRWFVGYTPYYLGVCWFGYDKEYNLPDLNYNPALRIWTNVMDDIHAPLPNKNFKEASDFEYATYCLDSGLSPTSACRGDVRGSRVATGWFYTKDIPDEDCNLHRWRYRSASMLDLTRLFPLSGIEVVDEYYCYAGTNKAIGTGERVESPNGHYTPPQRTYTYRRRSYSNSSDSNDGEQTTGGDTSDGTSGGTSTGGDSDTSGGGEVSGGTDDGGTTDTEDYGTPVGSAIDDMISDLLDGFSMVGE